MTGDTDTIIGTSYSGHVPVMLAECLEALEVSEQGTYIDGTFGAGGHTRALLERGARVLAIDQDPNAQKYLAALEPLGERLHFAQGNFRDLARFADEAGLSPVDGVLLDLGVSSMQLDEAERGFAFRQEGPLDMRMGEQEESAFDVVNSYEPEELAAIIYRYGEERHSRRIARRIVEAREKAPVRGTGELAELIASAYPPGYRREHPARRTFQALRIHVNDELGVLEAALEASERVLKPGGRLVVMSYHSLEDRIVKHFIKNSPVLTALSKRPIEASEAEVEANPRARSAKLRVAERSVPGTVATESEPEATGGHKSKYKARKTREAT